MFLRTKGAVWLLSLFLVGIGLFTIIRSVRLGTHRDCDFPSARTFRIDFKSNNNFTQLVAMDASTGQEVHSQKLKAFITQEAGPRIKQTMMQVGLNRADGHTSFSLQGCSEPYLISWSNAEIPLLSRLMTAAETWNLEDLRIILSSGINVNARDFQGHTALMYAAVNPMKELSKHPDKLEKVGAKPDISAVELLLNKGADPNLKDAYGVTPLHVADYETATLLLAAGADVSAQEASGKTPLMSAAERGDARLIRMFLTRKALVNIDDKEGNSALMYAVKAGARDEVIKLLLSSGADRNLQNRAGESPVSVARMRAKHDLRFRRIARLLDVTK